LRAVAVSLVVLDHVGVPGLGGGYLGVDVFFVVSGFLITGLLLREHERTDRISILGFYARRARRILPAATVVLIATSLYAAWTLAPSRVEEIVTDVRWSALFAANWHFAELGTDYFSQGRAPSPVQHFWSLAVEEQFYVVWPGLLALLLLGGRHGRQRAAAVLAVVWGASLAWAVVLLTTSPTSAYFSSLTRAWELATGALLAVAAARLGRLRSPARAALGASGLLAILVSAATFDDHTGVPGLPTLLPVLGTAAVLAAGTGAEPIGVGRVLGVAPVRWVGDASYSIYLWHWPVLLLGGERLTLPARTEGLLLVAVTLAIAAASYVLVEQPFRTGRFPLVARGRRALVLWPATVALVAGGSIVATAHADGALRQREAAARAWYAAHQPAPSAPTGTSGTTGTGAEPVPVAQLLRQAVADAEAGAPVPPDLTNLDRLGRDIWQTWFTCYLDLEAETGRICPVGDPDGATTVVLFGDSHAGMWLPALDAVARQARVRVVPLLKIGCSPFDVDQWHDGAPMPSCQAFRAWALTQIGQLHPDVVMLGYRGMWAVHADPGETESVLWGQGALDTLTKLAELTPRRIVVGDISSTGLAPPDCLTAPDASLGSCTVGEEQVVLDANRLAAGAARRTGAEYVDLTDLVCARHRCPPVAAGIVIYHDPSHVTMTWARRVAAELGDKLRLDQERSQPAGRL
jgi:peptidoglycan/LPS O-acetylase OafA/YrhL